MGFIEHYNRSFASVKWRDVSRARQLLNKGLEAINNNPNVETLHPIVCAIIDLMPEDQKPNGGGLLR